jgi:hypothetical protein
MASGPPKNPGGPKPATPGARPRRLSTRLAIVEQSLVDTLERLREEPAGPRVRELRAKAEVYERALRAWTTRPPTEEARAALLKLVLELNVEAMSLGKAPRA